MIFIGNSISFIAAIFTIVGSWQKERDKIYGCQMIQCLLMAIASIFFLSFSGVTTFVLCTLRNYFLAKDTFSKRKLMIFLICIIISGILANNRGILGYLPIVNTVVYSTGTFYLKEEKYIKYNIILNLLIWAWYEWIVFDFVSVVIDVISAIVAFVSLFQKKEC